MFLVLFNTKQVSDTLWKSHVLFCIVWNLVVEFADTEILMHWDNMYWIPPFAKPHLFANCRPSLWFFFSFKRRGEVFKWDWEVLFPHCVKCLCLRFLQSSRSANHERSADVYRKSFHWSSRLTRKEVLQVRQQVSWPAVQGTVFLQVNPTVTDRSVELLYRPHIGLTAQQIQV